MKPRSSRLEHRHAAALLLAVVAAGCDDGVPRRVLRLTAPGGNPAMAADARPEVIRVGIASVLAPDDVLAHYRDLVDAMGESLGIATELVQRSSYADLNALLQRRHCTVGIVCSYAFVRAEREFGVIPVAVPQVEGVDRYRAYVIVRRDGPLQTWGDLAGRRFALADPVCHAGWLYPVFRATQRGFDTDRFFARATFTYDYAKSIRATADGVVDAASVESPLYDAMLRARDPSAIATRILERSPEFGNPPFVVHPSVDAGLRERIAEFLLTLHETERGRGILASIGVDRYVAPRAESWDEIRAMAHVIEGP